MGLSLKAENNLSPIRNQIKGLITTNSKVIEFGCGKGDLLFELSPQIRSGLGIDKSKLSINYARKRKKKLNNSNIDFICEELGKKYKYSEKYDFSVASLFFHVIPGTDAIYLLKKMKEVSNTVLVCGFSQPTTWHEELFLWMDQKKSSHYKNFKQYKKHGYMEGLLAETKDDGIEKYDTSIPFIKIYKVT